MAWTGDPVWLADVLRAAGLKVIEHDGWKNRGHGDFLDIRGVLCHHTAGGGTSDWQVVQYGRSDLPGPLAQLVLERDGTFRVIAAGVCWHAGNGSWGGWPTNNANYHTIGIEAVNDGRGQLWPAVQLDAYKRGCAAIARKVGFGANMVVGHKEYSSEGKIDPYGISMPAFRADVDKLIRQSVPVVNRINEHAKLAENWIGARLHSEEKKPPDGKGRFVEYENAAIYWHPKTGAFAIPRGGIYEAYAARGWEAGELGYPVRVHAVLDGGGVQAFEHGVLYVKNGGDPKGAIVKGVIGSRWASEGYENGPLGWPLSDEQDYDGGRKQVFEHGTLYWHPSNAVRMSNG